MASRIIVSLVAAWTFIVLAQPAIAAQPSEGSLYDPETPSYEKFCPEGAQACSRGWSEAEPPEEGEPQVSSPNGAVATLRRSRAAVALSGLSVSFGYPLPGLAKSRQPRATCLGPFRADHRFASKEPIHHSHALQNVGSPEERDASPETHHGLPVRASAFSLWQPPLPRQGGSRIHHGVMSAQVRRGCRFPNTL